MNELTKRVIAAIIVAVGSVLLSSAALATTTVYVDSKSTTAAEPYGSPQTAAATIGAAIAYAKTVATDDNPVEILVEKGTYPEKNLSLTAAISVIGKTDNPADVIISNSNSQDFGNQTVRRTVSINYALARLEAVTLSGTGSNNKVSGGHLELSNGTVENCVITGGTVGSTATAVNGGNVGMYGGRLARCRIEKGSNTDNVSGKNGYGAGVYATAGLIENCLVTGNKSVGYVRGSGLYLNGAVKVVNCTVAGNMPSTVSTHASGGIYVGNGSARVYNTILYDNGGTLGTEYGANLGVYSHTASTVRNESDADWKEVGKGDFACVELADYRLLAGSDAVDAGFVPEEFELADKDINGDDRVSGSAVDIGCYELQQPGLTPGGSLSSYGLYEESNVVCTASAVGGTADKFKWDFGNGETVETAEASITYAYPAAGLYTVTVAASADGGASWSAAYELPAQVVVVPAAIYVNPAAANPISPYATPETAAATIAAAFEVMRNNISGEKPYFGTVRLLPSANYTETGFQISYPIRIVGDSGNPADVVFTDATAGKRAFTVSSAGARIEALTIKGGGGADKNNGFNGGHVSLSAGTFANCIIENGYLYSNKGGQGANVWMSGGAFVDCIIRNGRNEGATKTPTFAGNVYMTGGRLTRCQILNGAYLGSSQTASPNHGKGAGVYAAGGVIEDCLVKGNTCTSISKGAGIYLNGAVTVANCTVTGNSAADGQPSGVYIANGDARVVNTVIYGNGGSQVAEIGNLHPDRYVNCASSVENESCETWKTIGAEAFADYPSDCRPCLGSTLIDNGTLDVEQLPENPSETDLDGNPRVSVDKIDIGCYEYQQKGLEVGGFLSAYGVTEGGSVTATAAASTEEGILFKWNFGDGTGDVQTEEKVCSHTYAAVGHYLAKVAASADSGSTWTDWVEMASDVVVIPAVMFVNPANESPAYPYADKATAARTIREAFNAMTNSASGNLPCVAGTIRLLPGDYSETGFAISFPVTIVGDSGNPADVVFTDATAGKRAFTVSSVAARIEAITITGMGYACDGGLGGHIYMTAGTFANCVITGGKFVLNKAIGANNGGGTGANVWMSGGTLADCVIRDAQNIRGGSGSPGGNIYMEGGRLVRCQILNGQVSGGGAGFSKNFTGAGVHASGGVIENCLFRGNSCAKGAEGAVYLTGTAALVNCTVVGNVPSDPSTMATGKEAVGGVKIASGSSATVVGTVIYDNGGTALNEIGTSCLDRFANCASSVENGSATGWQLIGESAFRNYAKAQENIKNLRPKAGGPLADNGGTWADYTVAGAMSETDLMGNRRLVGGLVDIGCLERDGHGLILLFE